MTTGLEPIYDKNSKILILGSLPGVSSIKNNEYYYSPSNHFWKILKKIYKEDIIFNSYNDKLNFLKRHNIAVWDVIKCADREGSLDSNIKKEVYNDLISLIKNSNIQKIFINGQKAEKSLKKYMKDNNVIINYELLPSSSLVNTKYSLDEKIEIWKKKML